MPQATQNQPQLIRCGGSRRLSARKLNRFRTRDLTNRRGVADVQLDFTFEYERARYGRARPDDHTWDMVLTKMKAHAFAFDFDAAFDLGICADVDVAIGRLNTAANMRFRQADL